jgi:hypothetical protein
MSGRSSAAPCNARNRPVSATRTTGQARAFPPYPPRTHPKQVLMETRSRRVAVAAAWTCDRSSPTGSWPCSKREAACSTNDGRGPPRAARRATARPASEQLVAELGCAFVMGHCGLVDATIEGHAAHLDSWLQVLKNDRAAIFTAARPCGRSIRVHPGQSNGVAGDRGACVIGRMNPSRRKYARLDSN